MERKMMITGEVTKKPEHIELGKYDIAIRTKGGKELTVCVGGNGGTNVRHITSVLPNMTAGKTKNQSRL